MVRTGISGMDLNGSSRVVLTLMPVVRYTSFQQVMFVWIAILPMQQPSIGDLNIQGGTFDFGSSSTTVTGNITNDGTITGGSGTVTMAASGDQTISGSGDVNFNNLTVNKSSGNLILSSATNVGLR